MVNRVEHIKDYWNKRFTAEGKASSHNPQNQHANHHDEKTTAKTKEDTCSNIID